MSQPSSTADLTHRVVAVNGIRLHVVEAGHGLPIVLLHGFPEFWYSWRHQLPALADAGFHAIAPDLRGYNESDKPTGLHNYRVARLVEDVAGLIHALAGGSAFVIGHDWGGVIAWKLAATYPNLVRKLAILNAPHPAAFRLELKRNFRQCLRSSYILFFQLPWLPEWVARAGDFALLRRSWQLHPEGFTAHDIAEYKRALSQPGGLTGPLNYYRAVRLYPDDVFGPPQAISVPTLVLWGEQDPFLDIRLTETLGRWVTNLRVERLPDAGHWLQNEAPRQVNHQLIDFFTH